MPSIDSINWPLIIYAAILIWIVVVLYSSIKIAQDSERFAAFLLGRFVSYKGPGLVLKASPMRFYSIKIGDIGILISHEFAKFGEIDIPVKNVESLRIGEPVKIDGFDDDGPKLVPSSIRPKHRCPNCGQEF